MTKQKDPNKKHYFKLATDSEFAEYISLICRLDNPPPLLVWIMGENEEEAEIYKAISYDEKSKTLKMHPTGKLMTKIKGSLKAGKTVLIKIPIEEKLNFFTGGNLIFHPDDISYSLEIKQDVYKSQARVSYRLNASDVIKLQFTIDNQTFDGLDISVGGTSFLIKKQDAVRFQKGAQFHDCTITFNRKSYHIPRANIVMQSPLPMGDDGVELFKVGISFANLPRKTEDELYIQISTEARGEAIKNQFDVILQNKAK